VTTKNNIKQRIRNENLVFILALGIGGGAAFHEAKALHSVERVFIEMHDVREIGWNCGVILQMLNVRFMLSWMGNYHGTLSKLPVSED
jgi:hypothetical protein